MFNFRYAFLRSASVQAPSASIIYKARPKTAKRPKATPAVPNSLATFTAAAAALDEVVEAAVPVAVPEPVAVAVLEAVPEEAELLEELTTRAEAFLDPQMKDWQKVWPAKSLG